MAQRRHSDTSDDDVYETKIPIDIGTTIMSEVNLDDGYSSNKNNKKKYDKQHKYDKVEKKKPQQQHMKPARKSTKELVILSPKPKKRSTVIRTRSSMSRSRSRTNSKSDNELRAKVKDEILSEIKGELLTEMKQKNEELLAEIDKLKSEITELSHHKAVESVHNEWPKLDIKDRASLRKKLAKELKAHHNKRQKKVFKLEKNLQKKQDKLEKYKKEIVKLEKQLKKHGVKYVGPPEEDAIWRLFLCQKYRADQFDVDENNELNDQYKTNYDRRYSITHQAVKLEERQVQRKWAEIFTDLIFVAIIVKFASQINSQYIYYTKQGDTNKMIGTLANGALFFLPFWCLWLELTVTLIRFHDFEGKWYGLVDDTLIFIVLAGVIEISFQVDINADLFETRYAIRFLLGFGLCIIALLMLHVFYWWKLHPSKRYSTRRITSYSLALVVLFIALIDLRNEVYVITAICLSSFIMIYVSLVSFRVHPLASSNDMEHIHNHQYQIFCLESIVERFGIFSMIVIGESILALLIAPDPGSFIRYICVYFAFGLLFTFQLMYFGSHAEEGCHALHKIGFPGSVFWIFIHLPLSTGLLFVGIGLRLLVTFADLDTVPPHISIVLVIGTTITVINYYILRRCHDKFMVSIPSILRILPILICPCCLLLTLDSFGVILWCFIITVCSWFFDIILINEYETKPIWMTQHHSHGEFEFHPEEYNPLYLPIDSFLFCRNYDGEHGRTILVSLAEYIIDDKTLSHFHSMEYNADHDYTNSDPSKHHLPVKIPNQHLGVKIARNEELQQHMPKSPKVYIDQISHKIEASANIANIFKHRGSLSRSKSKSKTKANQHKVSNAKIYDDDDADSTKPPRSYNNIGGDPSNGNHDGTLPPPHVMAGGVTPYTPITKAVAADDVDDEPDSDPSIDDVNTDNTPNTKITSTAPPNESSPPPPLAPLSPPNGGIKVELHPSNAVNNGDGKLRQFTPGTPMDSRITNDTDYEDDDDDDDHGTVIMKDINSKSHTLSMPPSSKHATYSSVVINDDVHVNDNVIQKVVDIKEAMRNKEIQKQIMAQKADAIKRYNKHHKTVPAPMAMGTADKDKDKDNNNTNQLGLGVDKENAHSIKLRSPNMDGMNGNPTKPKTKGNKGGDGNLKHNKNQMQYIEEDEDEFIQAQASAASAIASSAGSILPESTPNSSEQQMNNLPVIPHPFRMARSRSHERGHGESGNDKVDWDSWVHEFEEDHEESEEHRHQWFSEFADLVFVAIIINFADQIKNIAVNECVHDSTENYIELDCLTILCVEAGLFFLAFFTVWYELSVTIIRFTEIDGVFDDMLKFLYLGGIVTMTLQMDKYAFLSDNIGGFTMGIIICLLCITLLHIVYYFNVENCQLYCKKRIILYCSAIVLLLIVNLINDDANNKSVSFIAITLVSIVILWISSNSFRVILTPNDEMLELPEDVFEKIVERWGIFIMIATGESILALIATTNKLETKGNEDDHSLETDIAFQHYIAILCAFGITYLVSHYYLESSKINSMHFHALMHPGSPGSVMWTLLHGILGFFLMMVGAGWKLVLLSLSLEICWLEAQDYYNLGTDAGKEKAYTLKYECCNKYHILGECQEYDGNGWIEFSVLLGASLMASLVSMYLIRTAHPKFIFSWKSVLCRFPIIFMIPVGAYWTAEYPTQSFYYSVWCLILMTIGYFVDHLFIDIYQTDIKPELRTFYNAQIAPELRQQSLQMTLQESKRKSLEFARSHSFSHSQHTHSHRAANPMGRQHSYSKSKSSRHNHH